MLDALERASAGALAELAAALVGGLARAEHAILFCGPGSLAGHLARELSRRMPPTSPVHRHTAEIGGQAAEQAVSAWTSGRGVLVVDATGEDGLNLQIADVVVHCRLPWSPNVLEQRLGRVDRYVRPGDETAPARQYLLAQLDGEFSISGAWAKLLDEGYRIFDRSASTLQDAVEHGLDEVWANALNRGPSGLTGQAEAVWPS